MSGDNFDQRQRQILSKAMAISAIFVYIYKIVLILIKFYGTKTFKTAYIDIGLIAIMVVTTICFYLVNNKYDNSMEKNKIDKKRPIIIDERKKDIIINSLAMSAVVGYFTILFLILFKLIKTKSFSESYSDIALIVILVIIINLYHGKNKEYSLPKTFFGSILPIGKTKEDKKKRYTNYIYDSFIVSTVFLPIDIYSGKTIILFKNSESIILSYGANILFRFIVLFALNYLWGEYNVKKHNKYYNSLLDDDLD